MTIFYKSIYSDDSPPFTFSEDDVGTGDYQKIDRSKLKIFEIWNDDKLLHVLHMEAGQRLIVRRRVVQTFGTRLNADWKEGDDPKTKLVPVNEKYPIYLVGWQKTENGKNSQSIIVIYPDGHTEHISEWKNEPFSQPILMKEEQEMLS